MSSYPGAFLISTKHGADEERLILEACRKVVRRFAPDAPIVYYNEVGGYKGEPVTGQDLFKLLNEWFGKGPQTVQAMMEFVQLPTQSPISSRLTERFLAAKKRFIEATSSDPLECLASLDNRQEIAAWLREQQAERFVEVLFEDPSMNTFLFNLAASAAKELTLLLFQQGDIDPTIGHYMFNLNWRNMATMTRDAEFAEPMTQRFWSDGSEVHLIPRGAFHELFMPRMLQARKIPCEVIATTEEHRKWPAYQYIQMVSNATGGPVGLTPQGRRLVLAGLLWEILTVHKMPTEVVETAVNLPLEKLQAWTDGIKAQAQRSGTVDVFRHTARWATQQVA